MFWEIGNGNWPALLAVLIDGCASAIVTVYYSGNQS